MLPTAMKSLLAKIVPCYDIIANSHIGWLTAVTENTTANWPS